MLEPPTKLRGDLLCLAELGGDPRQLLRGSGVAYEEVLAQQPISRLKMAELFDCVAAHTPTDFALTCGQSIRLHYLGVLGYRLSNCETIGDLLEVWTRDSINIGYPLESSFERGEDGWRMTFRARYPLSQRAYEFCVASTLAGFARSVYNLSAHRLQLRAIGFPHRTPASMDKYSSLDADHLLFDCTEPFVAGDLLDLDRRIATADAELRQMCDEFCQRLWSRAAKPAALVDRLMDLFNSGSIADLHAASEALNMSVRSIQRHLAMEGASFHDLLDASRRERALAMMRTNRPTKAIAFDLGIADISSFRRSFKRWTGMSCSDWRRVNLP